MIVEPEIKTIIFDFGAVIIDIDYGKTSAAFNALGIPDFDEIYSKKKQSALFDSFEKGILTDSDFRKKIRNHIPFDVTDDAIDMAWNSMLIGIPRGRVKWLMELKTKYKVLLLSNTNNIHVKAFTKINDVGHGPGLLENIFHKVYFSCRMGMRKPDAEIFNFVMGENNLSRASTLFVDDSPQHIEGAQKCGIKTFHHENGAIEKVLQLSIA